MKALQLQLNLVENPNLHLELVQVNYLKLHPLLILVQNQIDLLDPIILLDLINLLDLISLVDLIDHLDLIHLLENQEYLKMLETKTLQLL